MADLNSGKRKKKLRSKYNYSFGEVYPGMVVGHKTCNLYKKSGLVVPARQGWLWNSTEVFGPAPKMRKGWQPGLIGKSVAKLMKFKIPRDVEHSGNKKKRGHRSAGDQAGDSKPEGPLEPKPALKVKKKGDMFTIQVSPMKDLAEILPNEEPYMDCDPMVFTIIKKRTPEEIAKVEARKLIKLKKQREVAIKKALAGAVEDICKCAYMDVYCNDLTAIDNVINTCPSFIEPECICQDESNSSLSSNASWDIEYTPPFGCVDPSTKKLDVVHVETQFLAADTGLEEPILNSKSKRKPKRRLR